MKHFAFILLLTVYIIWFISQSMKLYYGYGYPPFDLAIFDQGLWLISHFHVPFVTIMGRNLFGDHTSFILLFFAPFYRLFPEPQGMLILQTLMLAGAAIPIYMLAQKYVKNTTIATLLAATYLLNPMLQQGNLDQFHPEAFQVLIIALLIYAAMESKFVLLGVLAILALLVKEDAAALVVPLGIWVLLRRNRKWGFSIIGIAVTWAIVANEYIIPSILGSRSFYGGRIPFGGLSGLLDTLVRRPGQLFSYLGSGGRLFYLWQIGSTTGFAFLLAPEIAAIGLLVVAENVVSNDPYMHQILYQYSMPLAPVLVLGTVFAIAQQKSVMRRNIVTAVVVTAALWSCIAWGLAPFSNTAIYASWSPTSSTGQAVAYVERGLPANASVSAWYPLVAHIDHRTHIYVWPTPFSAQNWGLLNNTGARLPVADKVHYLFLPVPLNSTENPDVLNAIVRGYTLIRSRGGFGLYEKS